MRKRPWRSASNSTVIPKRFIYLPTSKASLILCSKHNHIHTLAPCHVQLFTFTLARRYIILSSLRVTLSALGQAIFEVCTVSYVKCFSPSASPLFHTFFIDIDTSTDNAAGASPTSVLCLAYSINLLIQNCLWIHKRPSRKEIIRSRCWVSRWSSTRVKWRGMPSLLRS